MNSYKRLYTSYDIALYLNKKVNNKGLEYRGSLESRTRYVRQCYNYRFIHRTERLAVWAGLVLYTQRSWQSVNFFYSETPRETEGCSESTSFDLYENDLWAKLHLYLQERKTN